MPLPQPPLHLRLRGGIDDVTERLALRATLTASLWGLLGRSELSSARGWPVVEPRGRKLLLCRGIAVVDVVEAVHDLSRLDRSDLGALGRVVDLGWDLLIQPLVRTGGAVVAPEEPGEGLAQVFLVAGNHVVEALLADGSDEALRMGVRLGTAVRGQECPGLALEHVVELGPVLGVPITEQEPGRIPVGEGARAAAGPSRSRPL